MIDYDIITIKLKPIKKVKLSISPKFSSEPPKYHADMRYNEKLCKLQNEMRKELAIKND